MSHDGVSNEEARVANERLAMRRTREMLRLKLLLGRSNRDVARSVGASPSSVSMTMKRARRAGLTNWAEVEPLTTDELDARLYHRPRPEEGERPRPDPVWIHTERQKRKGITLELLHHEYLTAHPGGLGYTRFCDIYREWLGRRKLTMRQVHRAGEKTFVDYSGQTVDIIDRRTGEVREAEVFVAVLGASNYTFAEATWTQKLPDWTASHVRACEYFGGVTEVWVPDQLRSAVSGPHAYDPEINPTYHDLGRHYGAVIMPARPAKPQDKAKVEIGVQVVQRWILARLRNEQFFSLAEVNTRIRALLEELNHRPMKAYGGQSRRERFDLLDRPTLQRLPIDRFVYADWTKAKVNIDYHVDVGRHLYSVPYTLVGRRVDVRISAESVEVFHKGRRVAAHQRSRQVGQFTTVPDHMPLAHRQHAEWSPSRLIRWGESIGPATGALITDILQTRRHPEQGYRRCLGILRLAKRYGKDRLEAACARAMLVGIRRVRQVEGMLRHGLDRLGTAGLTGDEAQPAIDHDNVRGPDYYH